MGQELKRSENPYDWLGNGIYFWENDEQRALEWAQDLARSGKIKSPAVVGAVLDLGKCLNLTERDSIDMLSLGYEILRMNCIDTLGLRVSVPKTVNQAQPDRVSGRSRPC